MGCRAEKSFRKQACPKTMVHKKLVQLSSIQGFFQSIPSLLKALVKGAHAILAEGCPTPSEGCPTPSEGCPTPSEGCPPLVKGAHAILTEGCPSSSALCPIESGGGVGMGGMV